MKSKVLLITPPFTQLNTPYPATPYLKGYLNTQHISSFQLDLGLDVILTIFSSKGLKQIFKIDPEILSNASENSQRIYALRHEYINLIDDLILFLQGSNDMLAHRICSDWFLPRASRFDQLEDLEWNFGNMGIRDKARHLTTLLLEDISDFIVECIDPHFGFSRYAERLSSSALIFDNIYNALLTDESLIVQFQLAILEDYLNREKPDMIALSIPFPGNLFSALKCGQYIKKYHPHITVCFGGGYANTELRSLCDPRIFEFVDYITLDDGEIPLLNLIEYLEGERPREQLKRTFACIEKQVRYLNGSQSKDISFRDPICPDYTDLAAHRYLSVIEISNPMHRLWSDGFWNKLTMAHGCYWGRCAFCDTSLDYISRFEPATAKLLCNKMEIIIDVTGHTGFHFVDEAAPPALMIALSKEILKRNLNVTWWANIRFESSFTADVCQLLKKSGCIAVSGGLEVASDRILSLINKGVSVEKVAKVCKNFTDAGILTHAYLMYGFPTQTVQETINSLEVVKQLFENQIVHSGFWHQFALTAHSPVGKNPDRFNVKIKDAGPHPFANNDLEHSDPTGAPHYKFSDGLKKSLYNYMHDVGFDLPLQRWFDFKIPSPQISYDFIYQSLQEPAHQVPLPNSKLVWLENIPELRFYDKKKKGKNTQMGELTFYMKQGTAQLKMKATLAIWIKELLQRCSVKHFTQPTFNQTRDSFKENNLGDFNVFWQSYNGQELHQFGLLNI
ncbi:Radical SAM superfamily enzyme YgiQ, UPF0313 family [Saccharicrinis carchari]|uniref:Radical SAM superfamily enzyme YgiQ, UPF0313 family n=1 Tax=Saccharicrinis carchari TaxID=1168039 RepID=A0A521C635_SACCC|nr:radical SAM protein [Saccharicrinis carchari]SMO54130.1 Radical SAM superfamily enzyme YgiQ, UPF0313 family [Saccharicrinis carchari]